MEGLIFDIKKFAVHDGPGIRTTVFMKGCPLRCKWCHNPESLKPKPEIVFFANKCIGCGRCFKACTTGALSVNGKARKHDRAKCVVCGKCAEACYAEAQVMEGKRMTVEAVLTEVEKDKPFYDNSGGGVTVSGGEPMLQHEFVLAFFKRCKERGLHTALDTSAHCAWERLAATLPYLDLILLDMKDMDSERHKRFTGVGNELILENARKLSREKVTITVRIPVIPTYNDRLDNMRAIAAFFRPFPNVDCCELLPYHRLGESKWERLELHYELKGIQPPTEEQLKALRAPFEEAGLKVRHG
ncbi:MAG: glycyl-radical enzyme activating protein [Planctomycetes bacterium]|nr:glycyl-radical enzyme activating protein [Planctomycetota bacterium]